MKYHIHIKANTDDELKEALKESSYLLTGLYESIKAYDDNYGGSVESANKRLWKDRVKQWIDKNKIKAP